ncbi:MAG: LCP family protein, partial [Clostridiales bacterium]|nr:LCP family protein [Clostridiales bacterium]
LTRIQIDNYVEIDFDGFSQAIDALGGLPYDVEKRMINRSENIDLYPGMQMLDGKSALAYVRYRDAMGDVGRVERQQMFLTSLVKEVAKPSNLTRLPKLIGICLNNVTTDLSAGQILSLAGKVLGEKRDQIEMLTVPGEGIYIDGISYWQVFENKFERLLLYIMGEADYIPQEEQITSNE